MLIKITALAFVVIVGVAAWFVVPPMRESAERTAACQAVVDQVRRQIDNPGSAIFVACNSGKLADADHYQAFAYRDAHDPEIWHMVGEYVEKYGDTDKTIMFSGDAWRTLNGWEADAFILMTLP